MEFILTNKLLFMSRKGLYKLDMSNLKSYQIRVGAQIMTSSSYKLKKTDKLYILLLMTIVLSQSMKAPYFYINWTFGGLLIVISFIKLFSKNRVNKNIVFSFVLAILWTIIPIATSITGSVIDLNNHFKYLILYIFYISVSAIVISQLFNLKLEKRHGVFLFINKIWLLVNGLSFIIFVFANGIYGSGTFSGIMENRNIFAISTTIIVSYIMFFKQSYENKKTINFLILISFIFILTTLSVKGFVGWLLIFVLSNILNSKISNNRKYKNIIYVFFIVSLLMTVLIATDNPVIHRIERFIMVYTAPEELRMSESAFLRSYFFTESIELIKANPLTGIGIRNSRYYLIPPHLRAIGADTGTYSHNNFLEILLSGGIIAFIFYYIPYLYAIARLRKKRKISITANYLYLLGIYKLFVDFGSVNYDILIMNVVFVAILCGQYINERKLENVT